MAQRGKKGQTLIEVVVGTALVGIVVVGLLQALSVGAMGSYSFDSRTSALNTAWSQMEYVKAQDYEAQEGNLTDIYDVIESSYAISGTVGAVPNGDLANIQQVTVTVAYGDGRSLEISGYKASREGIASESPYEEPLICTEHVDIPVLPEGGFWAWGDWYGYYYVFDTGSTGPIAATWVFGSDEGISFLGSTHVRIYPGQPEWAQGTEGRLARGDDSPPSGSIGSEQRWFNWPDSLNRIICTTDDVSPGTYTVLYWNGEENHDVYTYTASLSYYW